MTDNEHKLPEAGNFGDGKRWDSDEALESLKLERTMNPSETEEDLARRTFKENAPLIANAIVHTALHAGSEGTRLAAQKYAMDRVLGKVGDDLTTEDDPLRTFLADAIQSVEYAANNDNN
jgi:hypothetical protein